MVSIEEYKYYQMNILIPSKRRQLRKLKTRPMEEAVNEEDLDNKVTAFHEVSDWIENNVGVLDAEKRLLFEHNYQQLHSTYFDCIKMLNSSDIVRPHGLSCLSNGLYVLLSGTVAKITFEEDYINPISFQKGEEPINCRPSKAERKEIISKIFGRVITLSLSHLKYAVEFNVLLRRYGCSIVHLNEPFMLLDCKQNCITLTPESVLLEIRNPSILTSFASSTEKIAQLFHSHQQILRVIPNMYQNFYQKTFCFREPLAFDNAAIITEGEVEVFFDKKSVCILNQETILVADQGFQYVSKSAKLVILEIKSHSTVQLLHLPYWILVHRSNSVVPCQRSGYPALNALGRCIKQVQGSASERRPKKSQKLELRRSQEDLRNVSRARANLCSQKLSRKDIFESGCTKIKKFQPYAIILSGLKEWQWNIQAQFCNQTATKNKSLFQNQKFRKREEGSHIISKIKSQKTNPFPLKEVLLNKGQRERNSPMKHQKQVSLVYFKNMYMGKTKQRPKNYISVTTPIRQSS